jgi:hypothetical protein
MPRIKFTRPKNTRPRRVLPSYQKLYLENLTKGIITEDKLLNLVMLCKVPKIDYGTHTWVTEDMFVIGQIAISHKLTYGERIEWKMEIRGSIIVNDKKVRLIAGQETQHSFYPRKGKMISDSIEPLIRQFNKLLCELG